MGCATPFCIHDPEKKDFRCVEKTVGVRDRSFDTGIRAPAGIGSRKILKGEEKQMHPVTPPSPPAWKAVFLLGLLLGVLLALLQVVLFYGLSASGHDNDAFFLSLWLPYLIMPALFAFLVKIRTGRPAIGNRVGRCAGIICAILLFSATLVFLAYIQANPPAPHAPGLMAGALLEGVKVFLFTISFFINALGILLAVNHLISWEESVQFSGKAQPILARKKSLPLAC
jgi:hypothetical protein